MRKIKIKIEKKLVKISVTNGLRSDNRKWEAKELIHANAWAILITHDYGKSRLDNQNGEFIEADAKLIAAAPELLDACNAAKAIFDAAGIKSDNEIVGNLVQIVLDALKKAKGEI